MVLVGATVKKQVQLNKQSRQIKHSTAHYAPHGRNIRING